MSESLLQVQSLSKAYGNLKVLDNVSFQLERGEIVGLVGRHGVGKSILLHMIGGKTRPSSGTMLYQGRNVHFSSHHQARKLGIELISQQAQIVDQLDVIQNIFLGNEIALFPPLGIPRWVEMNKASRSLLLEFGLPYNLVNVQTRDLTNEQRHLVSLMRAFTKPANLMLLDDVLPNLSYHGQEIVLDRIHREAQNGLGVVICSENLKHLFNITDRILVLFEGQLIADRKTSDITPLEIVDLIVGSSHQEQVTPVIWALESFHKAQQRTEELFQKQTMLHQTLEASDLLNRQLIEKLSDQVKSMDRLNAALQETQLRLMTEREEERKSISRDLHDSVIQDLLGLNYLLEDVESAEVTDQRRRELHAIRQSIRQVIGDLRQLCRDLRPPTIDNHGLSSAIPSLSQEWEERLGAQIDLDIDSTIGRLPEVIELSIFRIIQEGLSNVAKHADATHVKLVLKQLAEGELLIHFSDNGQGIEVVPNLADLSTQEHFGLVGISERVALLGGQMGIKSSSGNGFLLEIKLPNPNPF